MLKYYMGEPSEESDFDEIKPTRICIYSKQIYIPKLEMDAFGHIECDKPLSRSTIKYHSLVQEPRNHLPYQMITTRKELEGKRDLDADPIMRRYSAADSEKGPWKK